MFKRETTSIGDILKLCLRENGLETPLMQNRAIKAWKTVAGDVVERYTGEIFIALCNTVVDKYLTLEHFYFRMERVNNKYYPPLSSIDLYTNYILHKLKGLKRQSLPETLMNDMFYKFFSMVHCVVDLLSNGY